MSKLLPFWIKVIRLTIPIYIVGYLMFGVLLFTYINNTIKSDASKELYLVALDKKNSLYTFLQNAEHDVAILANSINVPIKESSFDTINNLLLAKNLQKNSFYGDVFICKGDILVLIKLDGVSLSYTYSKQSIKSEIVNGKPSLTILFNDEKRSSVKSIVVKSPFRNKDYGYIGVDIPYQNITRAITTKSDSIKHISTKIDTKQTTHSNYFAAVANYILQTYGVEVDKSGRDISRACFLPYDPIAYINPLYKPSTV